MTEPLPAPLLECHALEVGYGSAILPPIDLKILPNDLWAIVGVNGSGKSTWVRTALGLEVPLAGTVRRAEGLSVAYVPQVASLDPIFPVRVRDVVQMGTLSGGHFGGFQKAESNKRVAEALELVGAADLRERPYRDLSGGQRQRVLIARAVASGARLFFLDEPTSALDRAAEEAILELLERLSNQPGCAVAIVTHHLQVLRTIADQALLVDRFPPAAITGTAASVASSHLFRRLFGEVGEGAE